MWTEYAGLSGMIYVHDATLTESEGHRRKQGYDRPAFVCLNDSEQTRNDQPIGGSSENFLEGLFRW